MSNIKKRNWAFVLYPESAPKDWIDRLQQTGLEICISPLHDKDLDPTGKTKKAHYHVILCYSGPTSYKVVSNLTEELNQPIPQPLEQVRGYYRYLTHKDNPEKYQYDENEIKTINGFNVSNYVELSTAEINRMKKELQKIIRDNMLVEYSEFMDYLLDNELSNYYDVASNHTLFFNSYITSFRNKFNNQLKHYK